MPDSRTDGPASLSTDATLPPETGATGPLSAFPALAPPQAVGELGRLAGYRVLKVLGQGGMGIVFQGEDVQLSRSVALKMMLPQLAASPEARERFLREARAQAQIEHDHIVAIYQVGENNGVPFLVMPLLKGLTLQDYLNKGKPLTLAQIVRIGRDVARGLQAAHERGLIHRDIKPANLWLDASAAGRVKILDFGLARPQQATSQLTSTGMIVGTPAYMAPEQIAGKPEPRSDLYSLGVVLYRLLAGRLPFDQPDMLSLLLVVSTEPSPPLREVAPNVPGPLTGLVTRLLQKKPADRPGSAREVFDALRVVDQDSAGATGPPAPGRKHKLAPRRLWPLRLVASLVGLLAVIAVVVVLFRPGDSGQQSTTLDALSRAPSARLPWEDTDKKKKEITNSIEMKLVLIPAGRFTMGSPGSEKDRKADEKHHEVEITKAFYLGIHEVTQQQFKEVMGYNPSFFSKDGEGKSGLTYSFNSKPAGGQFRVGEDTSNYPVENVNWQEAKDFCDKLSNRVDEKGSGRQYRLPTEAEWEYACRGGSPSYQVFHFGNSLSSAQANFNGIQPYGGADKEENLTRTCNVGSYKANRFGLFDMHGNVWEWCADWYDDGYYGRSPRQDPLNDDPLTGSEGAHRVLRGGGWNGFGHDCRSAERGGSTLATRNSSLGFRVGLFPSNK